MNPVIAIVIVSCSAPPAPAFFETCPPAPPLPKLGYADVYRRVSLGESLTVAAGTAERADVSIDAIPGETPGLYRCYRDPDRGTPVMVRISAPPAMPAPSIVTSCSGPNCSIVAPPIVSDQYTIPPTYNGTCTGPNCPPSQPRQRFLYRALIPEK